MARELETNKYLISLALKEYDALRKGIDDRADVTKTYGWPVVLVSFGAIAGLKTDLISVNAALAFIPAIVFSIAALDANANHDKARARRALALVEDKIFVLAGEPALCHESISLIKCRKRATRQYRSALIYLFVYALIETTLCLLLLPRGRGIDWTRTFLFVSVLSVPALLMLYSSHGIYKIFTAPLSTLLLEHIERSEGLAPDGERLLYHTRTRTIGPGSK
ncbi:MAG TPA: hypothetical protein VGB17_14645 [Pyrinomonadaceae bacterium]|jgi:hypothetical protein